MSNTIENRIKELEIAQNRIKPHYLITSIRTNLAKLEWDFLTDFKNGDRWNENKIKYSITKKKLHFENVTEISINYYKKLLEQSDETEILQILGEWNTKCILVISENIGVLIK